MPENPITRSVIPAEPGWSLVTLARDEDDGRKLAFTPVIAWAIESFAPPVKWEEPDFHVFPIVSQGGPLPEVWALRTPVGFFEDAEGIELLESEVIDKLIRWEEYSNDLRKRRLEANIKSNERNSK